MESYRERYLWWEGVLMLQRLVLGIVFAFGSAQPGVQALVLASLSVLYVGLNSAARPLRNRYSHRLQVGLGVDIGREMCCR